ncbi:MAG: hypothetical protein EOP49_45050 [Sphingobacteriales bacterium]|nr:MAG: hypothetical protein EOP49_45050 [Sphingobacteriales bacterium]
MSLPLRRRINHGESWFLTKDQATLESGITLCSNLVDIGTPNNGDVLVADPHVSVISLTMLAKLSGSQVKFFDWGVYANSLVNYGSSIIRVIKQPEFEWFDSFSREAFFKDVFTLNNQSNRMGYQLDGEPLTQQDPKQLLSTSVSMGTIQVTSSGTMILLMADCQTTGGYPRIAQVAAVDLPVCAQLKPGDKISFEQITIGEAEAAYVQLENDLRCLGKGIIQKIISNSAPMLRI